MIPWFQYTVIHLGPIPIQVWGLWVALGMALSLLIIAKRSSIHGLDRQKMLDLALWIIIGGLIGARLFHVLFYEPSFYFSHPLEIFKVWRGGLSSFGGLAGAAAAFFICLRRFRVSGCGLRAADVFSYSALFGWMVGRVGCFMIHDHLGAHSNCPLAIETADGPRLEMALMEILGLIPLAIIFFVLRKRKLAHGWYTAVLFMYYGVLRFILDFYRAADIPGADVRYFGLTPGQYSSIILLIIGLSIAKKIRRGRIVA